VPHASNELTTIAGSGPAASVCATPGAKATESSICSEDSGPRELRPYAPGSSTQPVIADSVFERVKSQRQVAQNKIARLQVELANLQSYVAERESFIAAYERFAQGAA
jgi:hypothetical protein